MDKTTEFSFILKPSEHGIGVFAVHEIRKGTHLKMFNDVEELEPKALFRDNNDVPEIFKQYCMDWGDKLVCPIDFSCMSVGWHLNHSKNPNAKRDDKYRWYALRDIEPGEEITIDYNSLEEPEEAKEDYYK